MADNLYAPQWATCRTVTVEKRTPEGALDFTAPQPPTAWLRTDPRAIIDTVGRTLPPEAVTIPWDAVSDYLTTRGWCVREVTW